MLLPARSALPIGQFATIFQVGTSVLRVLAFGWASIQMGRTPEFGMLLKFVGYLPFFALVDIACQSWSRSAIIAGRLWVGEIHKWRISFAVIAILLIAGVKLATMQIPSTWGDQAIITICYLCGSVSLLWERWLVVPLRAVAAAVMEAVILVGAVAGYHSNFLGREVLILCFVGYLVARILVLFLPGRSARAQAHPAYELGTRRFVGYAVTQQLMGAISASLPSIFATVTGSIAGLGLALALFRAMHSFGAIASFMINAIGGRLFFGEAPSELALFERLCGFLTRWRLRVDGLSISFILIASTFAKPDFVILLVPFVILLAGLNFRSSFMINRGKPRDGFLLQASVLLVSAMAIFSIHERVAMVWLFAGAYCIFGLVSERIMCKEFMFE